MAAIGDKDIVWLTEKFETPPLSSELRIDAGYNLRKIQQGEKLSMPTSRPMPIIGPGCHELRLKDTNTIWRFIYRIDNDAIILVHWYCKKTEETPKAVVSSCKTRLSSYDKVCSEAKKKTK